MRATQSLAGILLALVLGVAMSCGDRGPAKHAAPWSIEDLRRWGEHCRSADPGLCNPPGNRSRPTKDQASLLLTELQADGQTDEAAFLGLIRALYGLAFEETDSHLAMNALISLLLHPNEHIRAVSRAH